MTIAINSNIIIQDRQRGASRVRSARSWKREDCSYKMLGKNSAVGGGPEDKGIILSGRLKAAARGDR